MAACIGQSLVKQNSILLEENSKLEAMLDSAKEEVPGWGGAGGVYLRPAANPLCQGLCLPLPAPNTGLLFPCQILHLRQQVSLRDDLLQLYSDSDEEEDEDGEEEEEERDEEEEQRPEHPCEASEL